MGLAKSAALWTRAEQVLAAGPATFSKHPQRFAPGVTPCALVSGEGCYVTDVDGNQYLDTIAALGPMLLGYQCPVVDQAVLQQVSQGVAFSLMHPLEVEVAELLREMVPGVEQVRFCLNGSDATNAAIRLARAVTGKLHVFYCGYAGFHDSYISTTSMSAGTLPALKEYNHQYRWDDWEVLCQDLAEYHEQDRGGVAALLLEVPPRPWGENPTQAQTRLIFLQEQCAHHGTLFILDEIVTGFRYALGGAREYFQLDPPDLVCLGKAMANGYPLAALAGPARYMAEIANRGVFMSATHGGHVLSLAAARATLRHLVETDALARLHAAGWHIGEGLAALFHRYALPVTLLGNESRMVIQWRETADYTAQELKTLWMQEMIRCGVLVGGPLFPQACMGRMEWTTIFQAAGHACSVIARALAEGHLHTLLEHGAIETDVFAQRYR